ncbi:MAG: Wzz/FepE/Etk N-terminal domain-containing protein [Patescibacteria group bacterium]|nr:Wzz/FepE/Etk N-terminal domain-containing protein [Patescibacteria group bacterium]
MDFKKFLQILWHEKSIIAGVIILVMVVTLFFGLFQPPVYRTYLDVEVKRANRPPAQDYQYDEYYAIQAANLVTDTIQSWLRNKNFSRQVFIEAGFSEDQYGEWNNFIASRKLSSQNLELKITADNKKTALQLAKIIKTVIESRVARLNLDPEGQSAFIADIQVGSVEQEMVNFLFLFLASAGGGLLLGVFLALVFFYWEK